MGNFLKMRGRKVFCIKVGGSLLFQENEPDANYIKKLCSILKELAGEGKVCVVVGGGFIAQKYVSTARELGAQESFCDLIGIEAVRNNARLLIAALGEDLCYPSPPSSFQEAVRALASDKKILVLGGFQPGQSTNAVAASIADYARSKILINATDVDGVYTSDPEKDPKAKKIEEMTIDDLIKLINTYSHKAGEYPLFDIVASQMLKRGGISLVVLDGKDPENIKKVIKGERIGTLIKPKKTGKA